MSKPNHDTTHTMYYSFYKRVQTNDMFSSDSLQLDTSRKARAVWNLKAKSGIRYNTILYTYYVLFVLLDTGRKTLAVRDVKANSGNITEQTLA